MKRAALTPDQWEARRAWHRAYGKRRKRRVRTSNTEIKIPADFLAEYSIVSRLELESPYYIFIGTDGTRFTERWRNNVEMATGAFQREGKTAQNHDHATAAW